MSKAWIGLGIVVAHCLNPSAGQSAEPFGSSMLEHYEHLPLAFEQNVGQAHSEAAFLARGPGYLIELAGGNVTVHGPSWHISLQFLAGNSTAGGRGLQRLPMQTSYFSGSAPAAWHTDISSFRQVAYRNIYPGIDVVYYGSRGQLEYDLVVAPGADWSQIRIAVEGPDGLRLDADGSIELDTGGENIRFRTPRAYQNFGDGTREVPSRYVFTSRNYIGFELGGYDPTRPLIIDPVFSYSTYLGGSLSDQAYGITVDGSGCAYIAGETYSFDFPLRNAWQTSEHGDRDVFVSKLSADGSSLIYSTYLGGGSFDSGRAIAIDSSGAAYVTGVTWSADFPTTPGVLQTTYAGQGDVFVAKLNPSGGLVFATYIGGAGADTATSIALDSARNAYVAGYTSSLNFPMSHAYQPTFRGGWQDAFVFALNTNGSSSIYSTYIGGSGNEVAQGVAVTPAGEAFIVGSTDSSDFPTASPIQSSNAGELDAFVVKLTASGGLAYATYFGGRSSDYGNAIAVDSSGVAYITGTTVSSDFPVTQGALQTATTTTYDAFVARLRSDGTLSYAARFGGTDSDEGSAIAVDSFGNAYIGGYTYSSDFPVRLAPQPLFAGSGGGMPANDAFLARLNQDGSAIQFSTYLGGTADDRVTGLAVDGAGDCYVAGFTLSHDFPVTAGSLRTSIGGSMDSFVTKLSVPLILDAVTVSPSTVNGGASATVNLVLSTAAPAGGATVTLSSTSTVFPVPSSLVIPAGQSSGSLQVQASTNVPNSTTVTVTAAYNGSSQDASITVTVSPPALASIAISPSAVNSGASATVTIALTVAAPTGGVAVALSSTNAAAFSVPSSFVVPAGQSSGSFQVLASNVGGSTTVTVTAAYNGTTRTASVTVTTPPPALASIVIDPSSVTSGAWATVTIALTAAAPLGGVVVALSSNNAAAFSVPSSFVVPAGQSSGSFQVLTSNVGGSTTVTVIATYSGTTRTASVTVTIPPPALASIAIDPSTFNSGSSATVTIALTAAAPLGGVVVALSSNNVAAFSVPSSFFVPARQSSGSFQVLASNVGASTTVTVTATYSGTSMVALVTVNAQPVVVTGIVVSQPAFSPLLITLATGLSGVGISFSQLTGSNIVVYNASPSAITISSSTGVTSSFAGLTQSPLTLTGSCAAVASNGTCTYAVTATTTGVAANTYSGTITFTTSTPASPNALTAWLPVTMQVTALPGFIVTTSTGNSTPLATAVNLTATSNASTVCTGGTGQPASPGISSTAGSIATVTYTTSVAYGVNIFTSTGTSPVTTGLTAITICANAQLLGNTSGTYQGTVAITSTSGATASIPVSLHLNGTLGGIDLSNAGVYRAAGGLGAFALDLDQATYNYAVASTKIRYLGLAGDQPVAGDWLGSGVVSIGVFRNGAWYFDLNNNGVYDANEGPFYFGLPGDTAIVGDWTGSGSTKVGVFRCPASGVCTWYLSSATQTAATLVPNANLYNPATTLVYTYGLPGDQPVANNWSGTSTVDQIGISRCPAAGVCSWVVENVGDGVYRTSDPVYYFGLSGDIAVVGDWNGNGQRKRIGVFRGGLWILEINGTNVYAPNDIQASFGLPGDKPVVGKWTMP